MESVEFKFEGSFDTFNKQLADYENNLKKIDRQTQELGKAQTSAFSKAENAQQGAVEAQQRAQKETRAQIGIIEKLEKEYQELDRKIKQATDTKSLQQFRREQKKVLDDLDQVNQKTAPIANTGGDIKSSFSGVGNFIGAQLGPLLAVGAAAEVARQTFVTIKEISDEVQEATGFAAQITGESGQALRDVTAQARALANTFNEDYKDVLLAANALSKEFNITQLEALSQIERGFINGANANGDLLDSLREYPAQFANAQGSADQFVNTLISAQQEGIFSDKGVDAVKEFNLRIREQSEATSNAVRGLLGADAGDELLAGVRDGSISSIEALQQVSEGLNNTEASAQVLQTAITDVFGGAGEDAGLRYLQNLGGILEGQIELTEEAQAYADKQERLVQLNTALAQTQAELADVVGGANSEFDELGIQLKIIGTEFLVFIVEMIQEWKRNIDLVLDAAQPIFDLFLDGFNFITDALGLANDQSINWTRLLAKIAVGPVQFLIQSFATMIDLTVTIARVIKNGFGDSIELFRANFENALTLIKIGVNEVIETFNAISPLDIPSLVTGDIQDTTEIKKRLSAVTEEFTAFAERTKERALSNLDGIFETDTIEEEAAEAGKKANDSFAKEIKGERAVDSFEELAKVGVETFDNEIQRGLAQSAEGLFITPIGPETDEEKFERLRNRFDQLKDATDQFGDSLDQIAGVTGFGNIFENLTILLEEELPEGFSRSQAAIGAISAGISVLGQAVSGFYQGQIESQQQVIDGFDQQIAEQEEVIEKEKELAEEGLANSVESEEAKLSALQEQREKAQEEQERLQRQQLVADAASQASALATAAAQIFAAEGKKGLLGIVTAGAGIISLLATFKNFKSQAQSASVTAREGYSELLGGDLHTTGGVNLGYIEAERGERVSIFNRKAVSKYDKQINAFTDMVNTGSFPDFDYLASPMYSPEDVASMQAAMVVNQNFTMDVGEITSRLDAMIYLQEQIPQVIDYGSHIEIKQGKTTTIINKK